MKKIVSLLVFFALLIWTWTVIHNSPAVGFETHTAIQEKMAELIKQNLLSKRPQSQNLEFSRLWSENLDGNKVRVVFSYKFQELLNSKDQIDQAIDGQAILERLPSEDPSQDNWKMLEIKTTADNVAYRDGSTVSATDAENPGDASVTPTPSPSPTLTPAAHH